MKKQKLCKTLLAGVCLILAVALCACGGSASSSRQAPQSRNTPNVRTSSTPTPRPAPRPQNTSGIYELTNYTGLYLTELYISDAFDTTWGNNLIEDEGLEYADWMYFETDSELIDLYFVDDNYNIHEIYDIALEPECVLELTAGQMAYGVMVYYEDGSNEHYSELNASGPHPVDEAEYIFFEVANESIWSGDTLVVLYATLMSGPEAETEDIFGSSTIEVDSWLTVGVPGEGYYFLELYDQSGDYWWFEDVYIVPDCLFSFFRDGAGGDWKLDVISSDGFVAQYECL